MAYGSHGFRKDRQKGTEYECYQYRYGYMYMYTDILSVCSSNYIPNDFELISYLEIVKEQVNKATCGTRKDRPV